MQLHNDVTTMLNSLSKTKYPITKQFILQISYIYHVVYVWTNHANVDPNMLKSDANKLRGEDTTASPLWLSLQQQAERLGTFDSLTIVTAAKCSRDKFNVEPKAV